MKKSKKKRTPEIGLRIQQADGTWLKGPSGIIDPKITLRELVRRTLDSDYTINFAFTKRDDEDNA